MADNNMKLKPIKITKKMKCCPNCKKFTGYGCSLTEKGVPTNIYNKGCRSYKKNKSIYF